MNGWGIGEAWLLQAIAKSIGEVNAICIQPTPKWEESLKSNIDSNTVLFGYSLGAFLLLSRMDLARIARRIVLLAPFFDFKYEAGLGGAVRLTQLKKLLRWLRADPLEAVTDFYHRAGLNIDAPTEVPIPQDDLVWGIECLISESVPIPTHGQLECYIGEQDVLLDAAILKKLYPKINVVPKAGHDLSELLAESHVVL